MCTVAEFNKSSSGDEIPERDMTYHLICVYLFTTELPEINYVTMILSGISSPMLLRYKCTSGIF